MENRSLINCTVIHKNKYGVGKVIEHKLMTDIANRVTTGGPDASIIASALEHAKCSYIIVENEQIIDQFDSENPFNTITK